VSGIAVAAVLTACSHTERVTLSHGIDIPEQYNQTALQPQDAQLADLDDWLGDFNSPVLNALVAEALENNREIHEAHANMKMARAALQGKTGQLLPEISSSGRVNRSRSNFDDGMGGYDKSRNTSYSLDMSVSWEVDLWGKLLQERGASYADYTATSEDYRSMRLFIAGQTARAWFDVLEAQKILELVEEAAEIFDRTADMVRRRYESGLVGALDVHTADANAASTRADVHFRRHQLAQTQTALEIILGRYPGAEIDGHHEIPEVKPIRFEEVPSELFARRPDLSADKSRLVAAELRRAAAWKRLLPGFRISGLGGWQEGDIDMISDPKKLIWSIAGGFVQPIFMGGQLRAQAKAAEAAGQVALARYTFTLQDAIRDVEISMLAERELTSHRINIEKAARNSDQAQRIAYDLYSRGLIDIFRLQDAQRTSLNSRQTEVASKIAYLQNRATLYLVLGGGIPFEEENIATVARDVEEESPAVN
jgi:NodT family efflux transporter outer membrane factor (OMF) lipoprotein